MSSVLTDFVDPATLTGLIRGALFELEENRFTLSSELPSESTPDGGIDFSYLRGQQRLTEAGVFRAFDTESPLVRREGLSREYGEVLPISHKATIGEREWLQLKRLQGQEDILRFIRKDVALLARIIGSRIELARADALWNGKVTINENGLKAVADFGRSASANLDFTNASQWDGTARVVWTDHANSTPIDDFLIMGDKYEALNGVRPARAKMSLWAYSNMLRSAQLQAYAYPLVTAGERPRLTDEQARSVLGQFSGLPTIELYDAKVDIANATTGVRETKRVSPADRILLLPGTEEEGYDLGATYFAPPAEVDLPEYAAVAGEVPGLVAGMWHKNDPVSRWMHAAAITMPALRDPNLSFSVKVGSFS